MILALALGFGLGVLAMVWAGWRDGYERPFARGCWSGSYGDGKPFDLSHDNHCIETLTASALAAYSTLNGAGYLVNSQDSTLK